MCDRRNSPFLLILTHIAAILIALLAVCLALAAVASLIPFHTSMLGQAILLGFFALVALAGAGNIRRMAVRAARGTRDGKQFQRAA